MKRTTPGNREPGFTLVELMITLLISAIIVAAIYTAYKAQRDTYEAQDQITEIQQNLRAAVWLMVREIRMAAFDPNGTGKYDIIYDDTDSSGGKTDNDSFRFDADMCKDGGAPASCVVSGTTIPEKFLYELYTPASAPSDYPFSLRRTPSGSPIAEYIQTIEFYYTFNDGTTVPSTTVANSYQAEHIQSVQISILGRAHRPDINYTDHLTYQPASGGTPWGPYDDHYRRRLLITTVNLRNQGL